jgi:hypothetical protein
MPPLMMMTDPKKLQNKYPISVQRASNAMSALTPKADIARQPWNVRFAPSRRLFLRSRAHTAPRIDFLLFGVRNFTKRGLVGLVGIFLKGALLLRLSFFFWARLRRRRTMLRMSGWRHQQHCRDHCYGERAQDASIFFITLDGGWRGQRWVHGSLLSQGGSDVRFGS